MLSLFVRPSCRLENEKINFQKQIQSLFELREVKRQEVLLQAHELKRMAIEDYISSLPPLSLPPTVKLVTANETTLWLRWARVYKNSYNQPLDPKTITYSVYMAGGFESLQLGDRVLCTPPPKVAASSSAQDDDRNSLFSEPSESDSDSDFGSDVSSLGSPTAEKPAPSFRGEIIGVQRCVRGTDMTAACSVIVIGTVRADDVLSWVLCCAVLWCAVV
jgi:hypothetical protein